MKEMFAPERLFTYSPDTGSGGGAGQPTADAAGSSQDPGTSQGPGAENSGNQLAEIGLTAEQQKKFDGVIEARLEREREKWTKEVEAAREKAKKEAEEARLAEQQNYQELANRRQSTIDEQAGRIAELEQADKLAKKYEKALKGYRDQMIEHVPDHIKPLLEGKDIADQLEWLAQNMEHFTNGENGQQARYIGPPPAPRGGKAPKTLTPEQQRQVHRPQF